MTTGVGFGVGLLKGMGVTLKNFIRKPFTVQYPEERIKQHPRYRGQEFTWYVERCTGCASCAKYCPLGIIQIVTEPSTTNKQEGDAYTVKRFSIEINRCMVCGLCVEACPYDALHMGSRFEMGAYRQTGTWIHVDDLKAAPKRPSTWFRPQLEEQEYDPRGGKEVNWKEIGREYWPQRKGEKAYVGTPLTPLGPSAAPRHGKGSRESPAHHPVPPNVDVGEGT